MNEEDQKLFNCWLAIFDILGFKNLISIEDDDFAIFKIAKIYKNTLQHLSKTCDEYAEGDLDYCWLSDTFLTFTNDDSARSYSVLQMTAKRFFNNSLYSRIPLRGAISVGHFMHSEDKKAMEFV